LVGWYSRSQPTLVGWWKAQFSTPIMSPSNPRIDEGLIMFMKLDFWCVFDVKELFLDNDIEIKT
jgi:hypothetical protein